MKESEKWWRQYVQMKQVGWEVRMFHCWHTRVTGHFYWLLTGRCSKKTTSFKTDLFSVNQTLFHTWLTTKKLKWFGQDEKRTQENKLNKWNSTIYCLKRIESASTEWNCFWFSSPVDCAVMLDLSKKQITMCPEPLLQQQTILSSTLWRTVSLWLKISVWKQQFSALHRLETKSSAGKKRQNPNSVFLSLSSASQLSVPHRSHLYLHLCHVCVLLFPPRSGSCCFPHFTPNQSPAPPDKPTFHQVYKVSWSVTLWPILDDDNHPLGRCFPH